MPYASPGGVCFAGAERDSRVSQVALNVYCERMFTTENASRGPLQFLEHRHGLAKIVERGTGVKIERLPASPPHPDCSLMILSEDASRDGKRSTHKRLCFFEALDTIKGRRVVVGC